MRRPTVPTPRRRADAETSTGAVVEKRTARGTSYALRFTRVRPASLPQARHDRRRVERGRAPKTSCRTFSPTFAAGSGARLPRRPRLTSSPIQRSTGSRVTGSTHTGASGRPTQSSTTSGSCAVTYCRSSPSIGCLRSRSPRSTVTARTRSTRDRFPRSRSTRRLPASARSSRSPSSMSWSPATRFGSTPASASSSPPKPDRSTSTAWIRSSRFSTRRAI